jgi:hypothetical protein
MRDPEHTTSWSDTFTFRVKYQESRNSTTKSEAALQPTAPCAILKAVQETDLLGDFNFDSFPGDRQAGDCEVMRFSVRNLTSLRSLPPTSLVLLLTPVIAPAHADRSNAETKTTDPFEAFGRELSKLHHRLRHVPYVPKIGMTDTHMAFIEQAAAVVIVICEPADSEKQSLDLQQLFADEVLATREDLTDDDDEIPFVLVRFDSTGSDYTDEEYSNVLRASVLSKNASTKAAQLLFRD